MTNKRIKDSNDLATLLSLNYSYDITNHTELDNRLHLLTDQLTQRKLQVSKKLSECQQELAALTALKQQYEKFFRTLARPPPFPMSNPMNQSQPKWYYSNPRRRQYEFGFHRSRVHAPYTPAKPLIEVPPMGDE